MPGDLVNLANFSILSVKSPFTLAWKNCFSTKKKFLILFWKNRFFSLKKKITYGYAFLNVLEYSFIIG